MSGPVCRWQLTEKAGSKERKSVLLPFHSSNVQTCNLPPHHLGKVRVSEFYGCPIGRLAKELCL